MTSFSTRTRSPFRYDVVGSFLRPQRLKDARAAYADGRLDQKGLKAVEDDCIRDLIHQEEKVGLKAVTDGEFRRSWWHLDFFWGLQGLERHQASQGYAFHNQKESFASRAETAKLVGPLGGKNHPFVDHFKFTKSQVSPGIQVKQTIPAPAQLLAELQRPENHRQITEIYGSQEALVKGIVKAYREVIAELYEAGCRTLQIDDCTWPALVDWHAHPEHIPGYGLNVQALDANKAAFVEVNNAVLTGLPDDLTVNTHACRGNYRSSWSNSGGYDYVTDPLFTQEKVNAFYLEYDTKRAGGFEPLKFVPKDKYVVLGLVTSKSGTLEDKDAIIKRIYEAANYHDLDHLCLSPQCGFASTEEGNVLTPEQQWQKIELIKDIAETVWK